MIILQIELMEPSFAEPEKFGGKLLREFGWLRDEQIPGDGIVCLYSFPSVSSASAFAADCFGTDGVGKIKEVVVGVFYTHVWEN